MQLLHRHPIRFIFLVLLGFLTPRSVLADPSPIPSPTNVWSEKMQGLYSTLGELLRNVSSDQRFQDEKNKDKIETQIKTIAKLAHELNEKEVAKHHPDPATRILAEHLSQEANDAYQAFHQGSRDYARNLIRSLSNSCIACHSRTNAGPQFGELPASPGQADLKPIELARFLTATRQFDRALEEYQKVLTLPNASEEITWIWEEAIRQSLSIAVRVKRDPGKALEIVSVVLKDKNAPYYVKQDATEWKKSLDQWKQNRAEIKTEEGLYAEGQRLITQAKKTQQFPMDHSADVLYLRASSVLFDLLERAPNTKYISEVLFMEAICNESIGPRSFENLPDLLYEECILKTPHSKIAQSCYRGYERQIYIGFTGSSGTHLPGEAKRKLIELWGTALIPNQKVEQP